MRNYLFICLSFMIIACSSPNSDSVGKATTPDFQNKGHEIVYNMVQKVGSPEDFFSKKDVSYTYTYTTPDQKTDVSNEKYIFDQELSYGQYTQHERTLPNIDGVIEQGYDGEGFWLKANGKEIKDQELLKKVEFNRPTNYYWFCMFQKLLDPGLIYEHVGTTSINDIPYEVVKISFESDNNTPTDIYQLYINGNTNLVDQFLFTVADYGVMETPLLMQVDYENVDGLMIPSKRKYKKSTWNADVSDAPWINVNWTNIKFNTGLKPAEFKN